jgi:hypothetical protein
LSFDRIPVELQALPQWVVWRYVQRDDGKWTKLPYDPLTMRLASVTDPATWSPFHVAIRATQEAANVAGIGFVLTPDDPYTFVDLDDPYGTNPDGSPKFANPDEIMARQRQVFENMLSYAELSPSGRGLHVISRGVVAKGKRREGIELYSSERYMTMTGNVYRDHPITDQQSVIDWLYEQLGGREAAATPQSMLFEIDKETDDDVIKHAFSAANGVKFQALFEGRWQDAGFGSQSEADFALVDMVQFFTTSRQQIRRIFMMSGLGQRDKAKRPGYVEGMIARSFDRVPANIDMEALRAALDAQKDRETAARIEALAVQQKHAFSPAEKAAAAKQADLQSVDFDPTQPSPYLQPIPGLMGAIAWFIYRAAPRPVPEIAVAGAIALMAGITGRAFNVNATGLNVYVLLLAKTGRGKEAIATGIGKLMTPVKAIDGGGGGVPGADEFLGPQEIASGQALIKYMAKTSRSFVSIISEFDAFLNALTARNVSPSVAKLKQVLLYSYTRSGKGQRLDKAIYSEAEKNVPVIPSPAITLVGEGTPDRFYELLNDQLIADGFLPRFSVIEYEGPRTDANPNFASAQPEPELVQAMARLCAHCLTLNGKEQVTDVAMTPDAKALLDRFDRECDKRINGSAETITQLWNRAHLKALKLAALIAVGCNWYTPVIDEAAARWAIECSRHDTTKLALHFETGNIGQRSVDSKQVDDIRGKLQRLFGRKFDASRYKLSDAAIQTGVFNTFFLQTQCVNLISFKEDRRGATPALHATIQSLVRLGVIDELSRADKDRLGVMGAGYVVKDWDWLNRRDDG